MNPMQTQTFVRECRNYYLNQAMVKAYEKADARRTVHAVSPAGKRARQQYEELTGQIHHVDHIRTVIRENLGIEAERMFTWCYLDGMKEENISARMPVLKDVFQERITELVDEEEKS